MQIQVTNDDLLLRIGRLVVQAEALDALLERAVAVMTPEQRAEAGISQGPPSRPAGEPSNGHDAAGLDAASLVTVGTEDAD